MTESDREKKARARDNKERARGRMRNTGEIPTPYEEMIEQRKRMGVPNPERVERIYVPTALEQLRDVVMRELLSPIRGWNVPETRRFLNGLFKAAEEERAIFADVSKDAIRRLDSESDGSDKTNSLRNMSGDDLVKELAIRIRKEHPDYSARVLAAEVAKRDRVTIGAEAIRRKIASWVKVGDLLGWEQRPKPGPKPKKGRRSGTR